MSSVPWLWPGSTLDRIIDGDSQVYRVTKTTVIDIGFHGTATHTATFLQKMRLNRINCPPVKTPEGRASMVAVTGLVTGVPLSITTVGPYTWGDEWMAEVTLSDGRNLSDLLILAGFALPWDGHGPRPGG